MRKVGEGARAADGKQLTHRFRIAGGLAPRGEAAREAIGRSTMRSTALVCDFICDEVYGGRLG